MPVVCTCRFQGTTWLCLLDHVRERVEPGHRVETYEVPRRMEDTRGVWGPVCANHIPHPCLLVPFGHRFAQLKIENRIAALCLTDLVSSIDSKTIEF